MSFWEREGREVRELFLVTAIVRKRDAVRVPE